LPGRQLVVLADASFAAIEFLWHKTQLPKPICMITRFRLNAALYCLAHLAEKVNWDNRPRREPDCPF
jgi:hypothetical protein